MQSLEDRDGADSKEFSYRKIGVALSPCIVPEIRLRALIFGEDEMDWSLGIHGENG